MSSVSGSLHVFIQEFSYKAVGMASPDSGQD